MVVADIETKVAYEEWRHNFLAEIETLPHSVAKGDAFVQKTLQMYYNLSEEDAIDATACAGAGDKGVDAAYISSLEDEEVPYAIVVQGKYGTAGTNLQPYQETQKFLSALKLAQEGVSVTSTLDKIANVRKNGGLIRYLIVTVEPLSHTQQVDLDNVRKLAYLDFGNGLIIEAISLTNIYATLDGVKVASTLQVYLPCQVVPVATEAYIGITSLADIYGMLCSYAKQTGNTVDTIYDHNIRKYLKRRTGSVNDGIYKTLENEPSRFIAYNNGITIICHAAHRTDTGLQLEDPYIVNGCQTTRTLYDVMGTKFGGIDPFHDVQNKMASYRESFMAIKVLVVKDVNDDTYASSITRNSNKQNAIRGKDFIALETLYKRLKGEMRQMGYFLETQAGEYEALPKNRQKKYPKTTNVINAFEATLCYAAGVLGKPYLAFGHSSYFAPGGEEFDKTVENLSSDDLFIPWTLAGYARKLGYTDRTRYKVNTEEHRIQTRYFFLFLFFRLTRETVAKLLGKKEFMNKEMYHVLKIIKDDYEQNPETSHPFYKLLSLADEAMAIFMELAETDRWYNDRSAFLKSKESIREDHIIQSTVAAKLKVTSIAHQIQQIMNKDNV